MKRIKDYVLVCRGKQVLILKLLKTIHGVRYVIVAGRGVTITEEMDRLFKLEELNSLIGG